MWPNLCISMQKTYSLTYSHSWKAYQRCTGLFLPHPTMCQVRLCLCVLHSFLRDFFLFPSACLWFLEMLGDAVRVSQCEMLEVTGDRGDIVIWVSAFQLSNNNKWRWWVWLLAAYRWTHSPGHLAWSATWRRSTFIIWTGWTLEVALSYDDSTINIVVVVIIIIIIFFFLIPPVVKILGVRNKKLKT